MENPREKSDVAGHKIDVSSIEVFHFKEGCQNFEDLGHDNGFRYWYASDLAKCLGYDDFQTFRRGPLNKAIGACAALGIPNDENFLVERRTVDGHEFADTRLSRFACYFVALNGDGKKPKVAEARVYFAAVAATFQQYLEDANDVERLAIRSEISGRETSLAGVAKGAGVTEYPFFHNAGYRGMYNMNLSQLKVLKRMPTGGKSLLDYMGKTELAANLFRITQTEERIRNENIRGQTPCEQAAHHVGQTVRKTMEDLSGTKPEHLPLESDLRDAKKNLKHAAKGFKEIDGK